MSELKERADLLIHIIDGMSAVVAPTREEYKDRRVMVDRVIETACEELVKIIKPSYTIHADPHFDIADRFDEPSLGIVSIKDAGKDGPLKVELEDGRMLVNSGWSDSWWRCEGCGGCWPKADTRHDCLCTKKQEEKEGEANEQR